MEARSACKIFENSLSHIYPKKEIHAIFYIALSHIADTKNPFYELSEEHMSALANIKNELLSYKPIQYITGKAPFYGYDFQVNESTLIPRPETEELVQLVIDNALASDINVLDIGTGSGCISIALKLTVPTLNVTGIDISANAIQVAENNAERLKANVKFAVGDINTLQADTKFHMIVSNPPYIPSAAAAEMHCNVLKYEPASALFVPDKNPLIFYAAIAKYAYKALVSGGKVFVELHAPLAANTASLFETVGFQNCMIIQDINKNNRFLMANKH